MHATLILKDAGKGAAPGILLVPQFAESEGLLMEVAPEAEEKGKYEVYLGPLAPGVYIAYRFSSADAEEYRNPDFLRSLTGGTPVQVTKDGESAIKITGAVR